MSAGDRPQPREEQHKEEKKKKKKNSFSKLCRETRSNFFLLLVSLPKLFLGTNFCKNVPGNKKFTKRISVPKLFLGTKEQKFSLFGTLPNGLLENRALFYLELHYLSEKKTYSPIHKHAGMSKFL